jgi:hypothetical protein
MGCTYPLGRATAKLNTARVAIPPGQPYQHGTFICHQHIAVTLTEKNFMQMAVAKMRAQSAAAQFGYAKTKKGRM